MTPEANNASAGILRAAETRLVQQPRSVGQLSRPEERHQVAVSRGQDGVEVIHVDCPCGRHIDLKLVANTSK